MGQKIRSESEERSTPLLSSCSSRAKFFFHHREAEVMEMGVEGCTSKRLLVTDLLLCPCELILELAMTIVQNAILRR